MPNSPNEALEPPSQKKTRRGPGSRGPYKQYLEPNKPFVVPSSTRKSQKGQKKRQLPEQVCTFYFAFANVQYIFLRGIFQ